MSIPKFDSSELEVVRETPAFAFMPSMKIYKTPVTLKEGYAAALRRKPYWQIMGGESRIFSPQLLPDNISRAMAFEANMLDPNKGGGKDMFGIEWEYVPQVGGSMVRPGKPFVDDANDIMRKIKWPDIDSWDWENSAKNNNGTYLATDMYNSCWLQTGFFERLISFMDFENAIMAIFDEDQKDAVHAFFDKLSDMYIRLFDKFMTCFPAIDGFYIHDDWGSQKETFFSPAVAAEMIVPYMRRVTDFIHSKGRFAEFHSCGQILKQVPNMIAAGWDAWSGQPMNDTQKIYELYGDQILIGVIPDPYDPATTSEEEQRARAREYADRFCNPKKPSYFNRGGGDTMTPAFREELYKQSRINYSK